MIAAAYGTVSDIEIMWTLISAVGFLLASYSAMDAHREYRMFKELGSSNGLGILAKSWRLTAVVSLVVQAIFTSIGIISMTIPEAPPGSTPWNITFAGFLVRWGLITASLLLTFREAVIMNRRRQFREAPK